MGWTQKIMLEIWRKFHENKGYDVYTLAEEYHTSAQMIIAILDYIDEHRKQGKRA